jgi:serine/threonine protein phosphatase PrpC
MFVDSVQVFDNGTINGNICHHEIGLPVVDGIEYNTRAFSGGVGHSKHVERQHPCGASGQDVHGHTPLSIYVADGHGPKGFLVASACRELATILENQVSAAALITSCRSVEREIRQMTVDFLLHSRQSFWSHSGATFSQMIFITHGSKRWAVTINIGDSEAFLVYKDRVHVCSVAHNWDNLSVYRRYCLLTKNPKPVCYNRWNASSFTLKDINGEYRPIFMYNIHNGVPTVNHTNVKWVQKALKKKYGTQSIRRPALAHENWGSCVLLHGRARGQNMATVGDCDQRDDSGVPIDLVHVYIHEIPCGADVVGCVQSDGISDRMMLRECGLRAWSCHNTDDYLQSVQNVRDDMSVGMFFSSIRQKKIPCPEK